MGYKDYLPKNRKTYKNPAEALVDRAKQPRSVTNTPAYKAIVNSQQAREDNKKKRKYGTENPTVENVEQQARMYNLQSGSKETSIFLLGAIGDGVISKKEASDIYRRTTGLEFTESNIKSALDYGMGVVERRYTGGIPLWRQNQSSRKYAGYSEDETFKELERLSGKKKTPQEKSDYRYLIETLPSSKVNTYKNKVTEDKENEHFKFKYAANSPEDSFHDTGYVLSMASMYPDAIKPIKDKQGRIIRFDIDETKLKRKNLSQAEIDVLLYANENYNSDKKTTEKEKNEKVNEIVSLYDIYAEEEAEIKNIYDNKKYEETVLPYEKKAREQAGFDTYSTYDENVKDKKYQKINSKTPVAAMGENSFLPVTDPLYFLTPEERKVYNSYYKRNKNEANGYIEALTPYLNQRMTAHNIEKVKDLSKEQPLLADTISVLWGMAGVIPGAYHTGKGLLTNTYDENHAALQPMIASEAIRGFREDSIKNPAIKSAYNIGMSIIDSASALPLGPAGLVLLGSRAGVSEARKTAVEGGDSIQIATKGIAAGLFEAIFEKLGLDNLFKPKAVSGIKNAIKTAITQAGIEATEETLTSISNILVDSFASGSESQYNKLVMDYVRQGMNVSEAKRKAALDMAGEVGIESLAGLVSGLFFGGAEATAKYSDAVNTGKTVKELENTDALKQYALNQDRNSSARKMANELSENPSNAEVGALLQQMIIDKQISETEANKLVSEGLNGAPLDEAEQAYYFAGANGVSVKKAVELNSGLEVNPERAIAAWQKGAEKRAESQKAKKREDSSPTVQNDNVGVKVDNASNATKNKTETLIGEGKEVLNTKKENSSPAVQNDKSRTDKISPVASDISSLGQTSASSVSKEQTKVSGSVSKENYIKAAEKYRTEENANDFDYAYNLGFVGEKMDPSLSEGNIPAVASAYVAGTKDARIIAERRANFDNRTPGLFTDAVTETLSKKIGSKTLNAIDALGKKLGVQIRLIQRGEAGHERDSYYSPQDGVIAINVNEIHGKLTGDKLIRFIANHEGIHRIRETSPKAYAEMERIALSKSRQTVKDRMARFGESKERATEEIVADYFGEVLTSKAEIKTLLNENRTVFDAIMEVLEWLVDKMRGIADYSFSEIAEARKLFQEALNEADAKAWGAKVRGDGEVLFSKEKSFSEQVSETLHTNISDRNQVYVGETTSILKQIGLNPKPMLITRGHLRDIHHKKVKGETKFHGLPESTINKLPYILNNPLMIFDSISKSSPDSVCLLSDVLDEDGNPIIVAIKPDGKGRYNGIMIKINEVATMFGKDGFQTYLNSIDEQVEKVLYINKIRTQELLKKGRNYLPTRLSNLKSNTIIHKSQNVVKNESSDKLFSRSEDSEDNVKYFPPGEEPRRDIKVPSEVNGKKVRRTYRTAAESPALTPEMAEALVDRITTTDIATYEVSSNKALADNAMNKVENDVVQAASEWKTAFDSGKMITDKDIALGEALIIEAGKRGDTERAIELISEVAIAATEAGKAVQAIKLLKRMTPEGQVYYLSKVVDRLNKERGKTKGKEFNKSIEAENKATEADKKYKQAEAKVKTAEEKLFDIETAIEEYTKDLDIEVKIAKSVEKIADLKKKLSEAKDKVKSADASSEKLGDNIKEIEGQLAEERKKLKEAMAKRDANLKERAEKGVMLSKLKAGVKRVDNATDHILGEIDILEDDISKVEAEYDKAVKFRDEFAEERRRLVEERNSLIRKTESAETASERDLKKISQLEEEISKLSDKYLVAKKTAEEAAEIRKQLTAERNKLRDKLERKENAVVRENEKISKLKEEIAQLLNAEYEASKELEKAKAERTLKQKAKDKARKLSSAAKMGANIIELPADIKKAILESKTEEELNESVELAKDYIAENMVATKAEMIRAWRYLSMLGNLRTQFRNIIGNGLMLLNVYFKNAVATPIETVAVYASHKNLEKELAKMKKAGATKEELKAYRDEHYAERTKTITLFKKKSAELKSFVTESWESNIKLAKGQSGKNDNIIGDINDKRTIFKSEKPVLKQVAAGVEAWRKATNWAMERGDEVFLKINYKHALTSYILSNKWDVATMTEAQKLRAEQYALKEAQEATFRDDSALADWINKGRNKGWAAELAIGGVMPFTKTPINITKRSIEYGPTGIVNAILQGVKASKGEATSADVVNALAKTFSGSVLAGLGFYLAAKALLRSKGDEEDEEYNYLIGEQDYSLIIGDYRFSIEWAAPAAIPLLFGASIYNAWFKKDGGIKEEYMVDENGNIVLNTNSMATHKVMNAVSTMFAPIFETSYLSGLTDSFGSARSFTNDDSEALTILGINAGLSYANQFIPTIFGQLARTIDPSARRNNDYDKTSILPYSVQRGIEKAKNKIPFLNRTSTPYVNAWGEEDIKQGAIDYILSFAENFVAPGYIEEVTDDELTDELWRLENTKAAEGKKVFPESVGTSFKDGETLPLTAKQRNKRQKVTGKKGREYIEEFFNSDEYGKLTDAERVEVIDLLWGKAHEEGIQAVRPEYVSSDTNVERLNYAEKNIGISPEDYALWTIAYERANEDGNNSYNMDEVDAALDIFVELSGEEWTDEQLGYLWQQRSTALSNKNPYGYALKGTPWYKAKKADGQTWKNER